MKKTITISALIIFIVSLSGCATGGAFTSNNVTNVELSRSNFNIVARDICGTATQGYLLGVCISQGSEVGIFGLVRIAGVDKLYDSAIKDLWKNYKEKYGDTEGKKLVLANIRQDTELLNTLVYAQAKYFITADVVEFAE